MRIVPSPRSNSPERSIEVLLPKPMQRWAKIATRLIEAGLVPDTPAVAACATARADERRWAGRVRDLASGVSETGLENPVLIGVGRVFAELEMRVRNSGPDTGHPSCQGAADVISTV